MVSQTAIESRCSYSSVHRITVNLSYTFTVTLFYIVKINLFYTEFIQLQLTYDKGYVCRVSTVVTAKQELNLSLQELNMQEGAYLSICL